MLAGSMVGLIAWLRADMNRRMDRIDGPRDAMPAAVGRAVAEAIGKPRARRARFEHPSRRTAIR